ncbi:MAG: enoyl-CoA hydratase [Hyphomicrobiaceae bacterium]|jgi:enoyl-CoA hydratase
MSDDILLVEKSAGIAVVTLNRPDKLNALSRALRRRITETFRDLEAAEDVGVIILTGTGRAFTAGLDLRELGGETGNADPSSDVTSGADVVLAIENSSKPVIGAINGFAITGGFELALACDVVIASREARFADTHARVGILPGWGLSAKLTRLIGIHRAKELSLTGNYLDAETAAAWGLINRVVEPNDLLDTAKSLATDMLSCPSPALRAYKRLIDDAYAVAYGDARRLEVTRSREHIAGVSPEAIAEQRRAVQDRGRNQS